MREKLKDVKGETLVEVLAALLICTLSVLLLFGTAGTASRINAAAGGTEEQYYADLSKAERQGESDVCVLPPDGKLKVTNREKTVTLEAGQITFYGTERLLSYAAAGDGP